MIRVKRVSFAQNLQQWLVLTQIDTQPFPGDFVVLAFRKKDACIAFFFFFQPHSARCSHHGPEILEVRLGIRHMYTAALKESRSKPRQSEAIGETYRGGHGAVATRQTTHEAHNRRGPEQTAGRPSALRLFCPPVGKRPKHE